MQHQLFEKVETWSSTFWKVQNMIWTFSKCWRWRSITDRWPSIGWSTDRGSWWHDPPSDGGLSKMTPPDRGSSKHDPPPTGGLSKMTPPWPGVQKMTPPGGYIYITIYIVLFDRFLTIIPGFEKAWDLFLAELKQLRVHVLPRLSSDRCTAHSDKTKIKQ